jgi:large subunit ribosomal protein L4
MSNGRQNLAKTLRRGEVSGGGRKPWRQKGTGRARFGSIRVPIWRGGGITFGPLGNENYKIKLPLKAKRLAIKQALSIKAADQSVKVIETFDCPDGKVKPTLELLKKLDAKRNILIVVSKKDDLVERATRNIPDVKAVSANYLNVFDIMNADSIIISKKSLSMIEQWLTKEVRTPKPAPEEKGKK